MSSEIMVAVGRVAAASRKVTQKPGALENAREDLQFIRLKRAILTAVNPEPPYEPLPDHKREELAALLLTG